MDSRSMKVVVELNSDQLNEIVGSIKLVGETIDLSDPTDFVPKIRNVILNAVDDYIDIGNRTGVSATFTVERYE